MPHYHLDLAYASKSQIKTCLDHFALEVHATLSGSDLKGGSPVLGYARMSRLQFQRAANSGRLESLVCSSTEMEAFSSALLKEDCLKRQFTKQFELDWEFPIDLALIHEVYLMPEARGKGLGLFVVNSLIEDFCNGVGLVILEPSPFIDEQHSSGRSVEDARAAIGRHWAKLGFKRMGNTTYWGCNPWLHNFNIDYPESYELDLKGKEAILPKEMRARREMHGIPL